MLFGSNAIARATPGTKRGKSLGQCSMAKAVITLEDLPNHQCQLSVIFLPPTNGGMGKDKKQRCSCASGSHHERLLQAVRSSHAYG